MGWGKGYFCLRRAIGGFLDYDATRGYRGGEYVENESVTVTLRLDRSCTPWGIFYNQPLCGQLGWVPTQLTYISFSLPSLLALRNIQSEYRIHDVGPSTLSATHLQGSFYRCQARSMNLVPIERKLHSTYVLVLILLSLFFVKIIV